MITSNGDQIRKGDGIILALWVTDFSNEANMNAERILIDNNNPTSYPDIKPNKSDDKDIIYDGMYRPAYVMRVIYNGRNIKGGR